MREPKMTVAFDAGGTPVHIEDAVRGRACDCFCVGCGEPVIARKGEFRAHSFAHLATPGEGGVPTCTAAAESELHLRMKLFLAKQSSLSIPLDTSRSDHLNVQIHGYALERRLGGSSRIPDLVLDTDHGAVLVEVAVTHRADKAKVQELQRLGVNALEVDVSSLHSADSPPTDDELEAAFGRVPARWLSAAPLTQIGDRVITCVRNGLKHEARLASEARKREEAKLTEAREELQQLHRDIELNRTRASSARSKADGATFEAGRLRRAAREEVESFRRALLETNRIGQVSLAEYLDYFSGRIDITSAIKEARRLAELDGKLVAKEAFQQEKADLKAGFLMALERDHRDMVSSRDRCRQESLLAAQELASTRRHLADAKERLAILRAESKELQDVKEEADRRWKEAHQANKQYRRLAHDFNTYQRQRGIPGPLPTSLFELCEREFPAYCSTE